MVIFICLEDLFGYNLPVYTFENTCRENNSVKLEDRTLKVFYNCSRWKEISSKDKSDFLKFLFTDKAESDFCRRLKERGEVIKMTARAQKEYMDYCEITQRYYDTGRHDGYERGIQQGKLENAGKMLRKNQLSHEEISEYTGLPLEKVQELAESLKREG